MEEKKKFDYKWVIIILLILVVIGLLLIKFDGLFHSEPVETVIEAAETGTSEYIPIDAKKVRIRINTNFDIENGRAKDLEFTNFNEGRLMELVLKVGDDIIYESSRISTGESIMDCKVDTKNLVEGKNEGLAEVRYYLEDGTYDGETHFSVNINY